MVVILMQTEWMGKYRRLIAVLYQSANHYSLTCKQAYLGDQVKFSPYEVQIMEHIMENGDNLSNMKSYADKLGLSPSTFSKYVKQLVSKGLIERYHIKGNRKDIILKVSPLGMEEYDKYIEYILKSIFQPWFDYLDTLPTSEIEHMTTAINLWGNRRHDQFEDDDPTLLKIIE